MKFHKVRNLNNDLQKHRPLLTIFSIGIAGLVIAVFLVGGVGERISVLQADFGLNMIQPGENTSLTVRIKNTSTTTDAHAVCVTVTPSDPEALQVENGEITVDILGAGEERVVEFSISVSQDSLPGKYRLDVSTSAFELEGENMNLYLEVVGA